MATYKPRTDLFDDVSRWGKIFSRRSVETILGSTRLRVTNEPQLFELKLIDTCGQMVGLETPRQFLLRAFELASVFYFTGLMNERQLKAPNVRARYARFRRLSNLCRDLLALLDASYDTAQGIIHASHLFQAEVRNPGTWRATLHSPSEFLDQFNAGGSEIDLNELTSDIQMLKLLADYHVRIGSKLCRPKRRSDEPMDFLFAMLRTSFEQVFERPFGASLADGKIGGPAVRFCTAFLAELGIKMSAAAIRDRIGKVRRRTTRKKMD